MQDLTLTEERHVRNALHCLRRKVGSWASAAAALHLAPGTIEKLANGRSRITAGIAFRLARLLDAGVDDLVTGRYVPTGACPRCGYVPDFADEETIPGRLDDVFEARQGPVNLLSKAPK